MSQSHPGTALRQKVQARRGLLVPGAANALAARVIEQLGFEAVYLSGAGLTNIPKGLRQPSCTPMLARPRLKTIHGPRKREPLIAPQRRSPRRLIARAMSP